MENLFWGGPINVSVIRGQDGIAVRAWILESDGWMGEPALPSTSWHSPSPRFRVMIVTVLVNFIFLNLQLDTD